MKSSKHCFVLINTTYSRHYFCTQAVQTFCSTIQITEKQGTPRKIILWVSAKTWIKSIRYGSKQCFSHKNLNFSLFSIHPFLKPSTSLALTQVLSHSLPRPKHPLPNFLVSQQVPLSWEREGQHSPKDLSKTPPRASSLGFEPGSAPLRLHMLALRLEVAMSRTVKDFQRSLTDLSEKHSNENH